MTKRYIDLEKVAAEVAKYENENTSVYAIGLCCNAVKKDGQPQMYGNERGYGFFNIDLNPFVVELDTPEEVEEVEE